MSKKPLIVFEGIEGSGKSYHINNVAKYLTKTKKKFLRIREPGGNKNSEKMLLSPATHHTITYFLPDN